MRPQPFTFDCEWRGSVVARMALPATSAAGGARAERSGSFNAGGLTLSLRSVHARRGSPLPLDAPIGYTLWHDGLAVGAVELNGNTPRLWRPAPGSPLREPVTLALALLWDPAAASH